MNIRRMIPLIAAVAMLLMPATDAVAKKKVHTIGDSTMANYATDGSTDKRRCCNSFSTPTT